MFVRILLILSLLSFSLVGCGGSKKDDSTMNFLLLYLFFQSQSKSDYTVSGSVKYEFVNYQTGSGLNWTSPSKTEKPCRQILVEVVSGSSVIASGNTDDSGNYSIPVSIKAGSTVFVRAVSRVMANTKNSNFKSSDSNNVLFEVLDNYYAKAVHSSSSSSFELKNSTVTVNMVIPAEQATSRSSTVNKAGAFSIVDTALSGYKKLAAADTSLTFSKLKIYWSVHNLASSSNSPSIGNISTSFYGAVSSFDTDKALYILGYAGNDTDEYDVGVIAHEFGHFTEDTIFRSDSIGGSHGGSDRLDPRLAFGEGFGNGISAIFRDDQYYRDTGGTNSASTYVNMNMETTATDGGVWSETAVQAILWDLYDSTNETNDSVTISFSDIYTAMKTYQKNTTAATTIISFLNGLKTHLPSQATAINTLASMNGVGTVSDDFTVADIAVGTAEPACRTNIYQTLTLGNTLTNQPLNTNPGSGSQGRNKYCATQYYKLTGNGA
ncbi:MAG: hypothetical protein KDK36_21170, partial [Leptospiraceae bacterium]|nr:hypothetical protein [Leptospiraceae bacterium]